MPSLNVDCKRKLKLVLDREYVSQEEIYKENVEPALNLLIQLQTCSVILQLIVIREHQQGLKTF